MKLRLLESALAVLAVWWVAATSFSAAEYITRQQPLWLLPGLYLVEMVAVTVASALAVLLADGGRIPGGTALAWLALGTLGAFILLGAMSIGFAYVPGAAALALAALVCDLRRRAPLARHLLFALCGAAMQGALMLALVALS